MDNTDLSTPSIDIPSRFEAERIVDHARRLFGRTLACWASDVLVLRRDGLVRPTWPVVHMDHDSWSTAA